MDWFEKLTGFREDSPEQVRKNIAVEGDVMTLLGNGRQIRCGTLDIPCLENLRQQVQSIESVQHPISLKEVIADVQSLHCNPAHENALFQVASQFNLLEMISPDISPESGITRYERDFTQGPASAIAAGAGTLYRNYFVPVGAHQGQSTFHQIDCLQDIGAALGNEGDRLWTMQNGYMLPKKAGLKEIAKRLSSMSPEEKDDLRQRLRIGVQWNTEVTLAETRHCVTQAYCSALPVAYSAIAPRHWEPFARLILEASYEATFCAAVLNFHRTGNNQVFLTLLGGGAFGNREGWIMDAIARSLNRYFNSGLDVVIVSYRRSKSSVRKLIKQFTS